MLFAAGVRDLDEIRVAQPRRLREHRLGNGNILMTGKPPDHRDGRLRHRRKLRAELGERDPCADIGERTQLDRVDEALENVCEQRMLLDIHVACRGDEQGRDPLGHH